MELLDPVNGAQLFGGHQEHAAFSSEIFTESFIGHHKIHLVHIKKKW